MKLVRALVGGLVMTAFLLLARLVAGAAPEVPAAAPPTTASPARQASLTVFAAASLADAFREIGAMFEAERSVPVTFNVGASSQLRTQLAQGAPADVFASADQAQMDNARREGSVVGADVTFARNRLVMIAPRDNPAGIQGAADLARPGVRWVTAGPEVPIGTYTQTMLERMSRSDLFGADFQERANANIVSREPNVRQVVGKVQLGEADAAVVYLTDVTPQSAADLLTIAIPDELNTVATYPIAVVANAAQPELGQAFVELVLSPAGQRVLEAWGFTPVGPTMLVPAPSDGPMATGPGAGYR